jgi:hypothetical protein
MTAALPFVVVALLATGCSTAHTARPLGKGRQAVHVSIGGPIAGIGSDRTPIPLVTATYKVGVTDRLDVYAGWHVIETFLNHGNLYFDLGASYYFLDQKGALPGVSGAFTLSPLINRESGWASMDLQATFSWAFGPRERHLVYVGFHNYFTPLVQNPTSVKVPYTFSPYLGAQVRIGRHRRFGIGGEIKWHRPWVDTDPSVLGYMAPGKRGAIAFVAGFTAYIGKDTKPPLDSMELPPTTDPNVGPVEPQEES